MTFIAGQSGPWGMIGVCVVIASTFLPLTASAVDRSSARPSESDEAAKATELMRLATEQYRKGDLERAKATFLEVWALKQHPAVAASLGEVEMKLGLYREAAAHWSYYLTNLPPDRDRSDGERALAECRKYVASIRLKVDSADADVFLDNQPLKRGSLSDELWVDPGVHAVEARGSDGRTAVEQIAVGAGEARDVRLSLVTVALPPAPSDSPKPATAPTRTANEPRSTAGSDLRIPIVITGSLLTAAAAAIGIVYSGKENQAQDDVSQHQKEVDGATTNSHLRAADGGCSSLAQRPPSACAALADSVNTVVRNRNIKTAAFISGGVLGLATVATYVLWPSSAESAGRTGGLRIEPLSQRAHGIQLRMSF